MRGAALFVAAGVLLASGQAHADLIGTTVDAIFFGPDTTAASATDFGTATVNSTVEYNSATNATAAVEGVNIEITGTQIIITNILFPNQPFCSTSGTPCGDLFDGFKFIFSGFAAGVHITGVSTNAASAADFQPVAPLTSDTSSVLVDVENDAPAIGDQLILDVVLSSPSSGGGGTVSEPASFLMLASGLLALSGFAAWPRQATRQ